MIHRRVFLCHLAAAAAGVTLAPRAVAQMDRKVYLPLVTAAPMERFFGIGAHKPYDTHGGFTKLKGLHALGISWYFDWSLTPTVFLGLEAVPMYYSLGSIGKPVGGNSRWRLGYNEPDMVSQGDVNPRDGAIGWRQIEADNEGHLLASPAVSPEGLGWLVEWKNEYTSLYGRLPRINAVAVHSYPRTFEYFEKTIEAFAAFAADFGVRLWLTEYGYLTCWPGGVTASAAMVDCITAYTTDKRDLFYRVAPFILTSTGKEGWSFGTQCYIALVDYDTGILTPVGNAYAKHTFADPSSDLNGDGVVDILDLTKVAKDFGKPVPRGH